MSDASTRGNLKVSPDGHYLVEPDDEPFFWLGDTAWHLFHRLDRDDADRYLRDRAEKGFTVIQAAAHGSIFANWATAPNRYGHPPVLDGDPTRPNPDYFAHVDWVIDRTAELGMRTALLPVWSSTSITSYDERTAHAYGRWIGERYRDRGLIWTLGGDTNPVRVTEPGVLIDDRPIYDALAHGIRESVGPDALMTFHAGANAPLAAAHPRLSLYFADRDWFSFSMLQTSHHEWDDVDENGGAALLDYRYSTAPVYFWSGPHSYVPVGAEYRAKPTRPVIDGEPRYEDHPWWLNPPETRGLWRAYDMRNAAYHALFAGAAGHTYGHVSVWDFATGGEEVFREFGRPTWTEALDAPGAGQMRHAKALLTSRPFLTRVPDDSIVVGELGEGAAHVSATRDADGAFAFVYTPHGRTVTVDLERLTGRELTGWWFDPRTGHATRIDDALTTDCVRVFTPPTSGPDQDWVLVLDDAARGFPVPGAR